MTFSRKNSHNCSNHPLHDLVPRAAHARITAIQTGGVVSSLVSLLNAGPVHEDATNGTTEGCHADQRQRASVSLTKNPSLSFALSAVIHCDKV
jgi:hypothetical protein